MREIKFRAWDKKLKEMTYLGFNVRAHGSVFWTITIDGHKQNEKADVDLMQYTGLKDKNGKEIYEGDTVSIDNSEIRKVIFAEGGFALQTVKKQEFNGDFPPKLLHTHIKMYMETPDSSFVEIKGNIYEDKKLLNG